MNVLTSGVQSGLGRYLYENLGGIGLTRETSIAERNNIRQSGVDTIIHCAVNTERDINSGNLGKYINDNILLTEEMVSYPHRKFVFLSSIDVYPAGNHPHTEDEIIEVNKIKELYGVTKLASESIIKDRCKNYLILRGTVLLGRYSRKNSLIRILDDDDCTLTLSADSTFNYILHSEILSFFQYSIEQDITGVYNMASSENITLREVAGIVSKEVKFGDYIYDTGKIDNSRITSIFPSFGITSREVIERFLEERN
ncbi:MAG: NAD(P)-dependent oxidoreductase [Dehalococcoidales bacterium]|nr:NAD(P)-dependent oxidoreductase [Dehalococcoidales bacterium]